MEIDFSDDQIYLVRDAFREMCYRSIVTRNFEDAQDDLGIINTIQRYLGEYEYDDLDHFMLHNDGLVPDLKERVSLPSEERAVAALIQWSKSLETEVTETLQETVEHYFSESHINKGCSSTHVVSHRQIALDHLITLCIGSCNSKELKKIDIVKQQLAEHIISKQ